MSVSCLDDVVRFVQCSGGASSSTAHYPDVYLDLEHAEPTETERDTYYLVAAGLKQADRILEDLSNYGKGASEEIREAIRSHGDPIVQERTANALRPLVLRQREYYRFAINMEGIMVLPQVGDEVAAERLVGLVLWELCSGPLPALEALEAKQGLAKQLACLLHFVSRFDAVKMSTPCLQNDFSFYRRSLARRGLSTDFSRLSSQSNDTPPTPSLLQDEDEVSEDEANLMSFFYAQATPMLDRLKCATRSFVSEHPELGRENAVELLGALGNVCRVMAETPGLESRLARGEETMALCLHVLTLTALLYDELSPGGLADRHSLIDPRLAVKALRERGREDLVAALRYQAKSLHPAHAPSSLRHLFPPN